MTNVTTSKVVTELDGTSTEYEPIDVEGDRVERLLRELFEQHWGAITAGPAIQGAVFEIRFAAPPKVTMLDGYMTVDTGPWHFHLCVGEHRGTASPELARQRRMARAAFFRTVGAGCTPTSWGLRLWNGRGEQMVTVFFPNPHYGENFERLDPPRWEKLSLWNQLRTQYLERAA